MKWAEAKSKVYYNPISFGFWRLYETSYHYPATRHSTLADSEDQTRVFLFDFSLFKDD